MQSRCINIYNRGEGNNSKKRQDKARQEEKLTNLQTK